MKEEEYMKQVRPLQKELSYPLTPHKRRYELIREIKTLWEKYRVKGA